MLFIWTNNGGPLQYIGLVLFLLQVILPQLMFWMDGVVDDILLPQDGHYVQSSSLSSSRQERQGQRENHQQQYRHYHQSSSTSPVQPWDVAFVLSCVGIFLVLLLVFFFSCSNEEPSSPPPPQQEQQQSRQQRSEQDANYPVHEPPPSRGLLQRTRLRLLGWKNQTRRRLLNLTGREFSDTEVSCLTGVVVGFIVMIAIVLVDIGFQNDGGSDSTSSNNGVETNGVFSFSQIMYWIPHIYQVVGLGALGYELFQRGGFRENGRPRQEFERRVNPRLQQAKLEKMIHLVRKIPLEKFAIQRDGNNDNNDDNYNADGDHDSRTSPCDCYPAVTIPRLKEMLRVRGIPEVEINSYKDRRNLTERLQKCRQYSDTCCICFEDYKEEEPIRVLPKCHHELHVECLDKWVYTFANNPNKIQQEPTCPLCKEELK